MKIRTIRLSDAAAHRIKLAATSAKAVSGLTHNYYRYPARFSPIFTNQIIKSFTKHGEYVLDPFVGGGTTLVEARALGRRAIGVDINSLATFITKTKTTLLSVKDTREILHWSKSINSKLNLRNKVTVDESRCDYLKNINCRSTWPIRNTIQLAIDYTENLSSKKQSDFVRCALLNSSQWALETTREIKSACALRNRYVKDIESMTDSAIKYHQTVIAADREWINDGKRKINIINKSAAGIENHKSITALPAPKLILTSPPYPGVHILYHRWQVNGRRETPAPYWIANKLDGSGESYYTFGYRNEESLTSYFRNTYESFRSLAQISDQETVVVQMIAFSEPDWQLPLYLETLEQAGFQEFQSEKVSNSNDGRLWRQVPNRKWHASIKGETSSSKEVVLFHKLSN